MCSNCIIQILIKYDMSASVRPAPEIYAKTNPKIKEEQLRKHGAAVDTPDRYGKEKKEDLIDWLKKNL